MIYLKFRGRIGNQIFMYAFCREIQYEKGKLEEIIIEDADNKSIGYRNSLKEYNLPNVKFVDEMTSEYKRRFWLQSLIARVDNRILKKLDLNQSFRFEKRWQKVFNALGLIKIRDGYMGFSHRFRKDTFVDGYFQSEKYFPNVKDDIIATFAIEDEVSKSGYPNLNKIKERNTVCISIKVEDNANNPMYSVCDEEYYKKAIQYMYSHIENPLFFICSDNVQYVKENLIDTTKYDVIEQNLDYSVEVSLAVMAQCKHFIIGNSSYAWWAQYLAGNSNKIVIAPSKWYGVPADWQWDIYCANWVRIEV